jgi:hypothetical protein
MGFFKNTSAYGDPTQIRRGGVNTMPTPGAHPGMNQRGFGPGQPMQQGGGWPGGPPPPAWTRNPFRGNATMGDMDQPMGTPAGMRMNPDYNQYYQNYGAFQGFQGGQGSLGNHDPSQMSPGQMQRVMARRWDRQQQGGNFPPISDPTPPPGSIGRPIGPGRAFQPAPPPGSIMPTVPGSGVNTMPTPGGMPINGGFGGNNLGGIEPWLRNILGMIRPEGR